MTAKKRSPRNAPNPPTPSVDAEGFLCLSGDLFWKYRALDSDYARAQLELLQVKANIKAEIDRCPALKDLLAREGNLLAKSALALNELQMVNLEIEGCLGISLENCAIDDRTGRVYDLNPDGEKTAKRPKMQAGTQTKPKSPKKLQSKKEGET